MIVKMIAGYYFIVNETSFDLYYQDPEKKTPKLLGYITDMNRLVKVTIQHNLSRQNGKELNMDEFLEKWKRMSDKLSTILATHGL